MYNENLKLAFIKGQIKSESSAELCKSVFNSFESYEVEAAADLCTWSAKQLRPVIESIVGLRVHSKWAKLILLKKYVAWCVASGVPGAINCISEINTLGISKVKTMTVSVPASLQAYLDCIFEPESEKTIDNIYRCYYWLAYSGVPEEDILLIKTQDVDFEEMCVHFNGQDFIIYRESLPAFRNCVTLNEFVYKHPNYIKPAIKYRADGDALIRGIKPTMSTMAMRTELSRRAKRYMDEGKTNIRLSYYRAWLSGLFYRMYERELAGFPADFTGTAERFMDGKTYKLDSGRNTPEAKKRQIVNDYMQDYERWKLAHII